MKYRYLMGFGLKVAPIVAAVTGCSGAGAPEPSDPALGMTQQAAATSVDYTDGSGTVKVRVKTCDWTPSSTVNCAYCGIDPGWVRIGGGAEILGESTDARLKASFPSLNPAPIAGCTGNGDGMGDQRTAWVARSAGSSNHQLRAYIIGLQLVGLDAASLQAQVYTFESTSGGDHLGNVVTWSAPTFPAEEKLLIGGGAEIVFNTANGYLTESRPVFEEWHGAATFATDPPDGGLKIYATGIPLCPTGWSGCLRFQKRAFASTSGTGYRTAALSTPYPWVNASVGGLGNVSGSSGRYLADLIPFNGAGAGATVRTKDHVPSVTGQATGYMINLVKNGGIWNSNSLTFDSGARMSRSPNVLKQSTASPLPAEQKWHLEPLGGGVYRLRNGNPGSGSDCAFYKSTSASARVAACGSGNDFKWTVFSGDWELGFQLRNVASGTCLDNNNIGWADGDVLLKPCVAGAARQRLSLDALNWPN